MHTTEKDRSDIEHVHPIESDIKACIPAILDKAWGILKAQNRGYLQQDPSSITVITGGIEVVSGDFQLSAGLVIRNPDTKMYPTTRVLNRSEHQAQETKK
jgi:hypothetical protein